MATAETGLNNARSPATRVSSADDNAVANMVEQVGVQLSRLFGAGVLLDTHLNGTLSGGTGIAISPGLAILGTAGHELPWPLLSTKTLSFVATPANPGELLFVPSTANQVLYISRELEADGFPKFVLSGGIYPHPILTFTTGASTITSVVSNFPASRINIMGTRQMLNTSADRQAGYLASKLLAGTGLALSTQNAGANETRTVALTTPVAVANGGTNLASYTIGDILYASGATTIAKLAAVAVGQVLTSAGTGTAPAWSANLALTGTAKIGGAISGNATTPTLGRFLKTMTDADYTPSSSEYEKLVMEFSGGSLTATRNIILPNTAGATYFVANLTTGAQALVFKVSGQTGVTVANGKRATIHCNGTDYVRFTADV